MPLLWLFRLLLSGFFGLWGIWLGMHVVADAMGDQFTWSPQFVGEMIFTVALGAIAVLVIYLPADRGRRD